MDDTLGDGFGAPKMWWMRLRCLISFLLLLRKMSRLQAQQMSSLQTHWFGFETPSPKWLWAISCNIWPQLEC